MQTHVPIASPGPRLLTVGRPLLGFLALLATVPAFAADITVSPGQSIVAALGGATSGDRVLVEAGTYAEAVTLVDGVELLGGYDASFSDANRDPDANLTVISGSGVAPAITSGPGIGSATRVDGFRLTGGGGSPGTGVLVNGGAPVFSNNEIRGNRRPGAAGGMYVFGGSTARIEGNDFIDNSSAGSGGGMRVENSDVEIVGNLFEECIAPHHGGGIYAVRTAMACSSNVFRDCRVRDHGGGGIYLQNCRDDAVLVGNVFENCEAPYGGGAFVKDESYPFFQDCLFDGCTASVSGGGAAVIGVDITGPTFQDCRWRDCEAFQSGGGLYVDGSEFFVLGTDFATATSPVAWFERCLASQGGNGCGGGIAAYTSRGTVDRVRFTECESDSMGGGAYFRRSEMLVTMNVIERCLADDGGGVVLHTANVATPHSSVLNNTIHACAGTASSGRPGGGITYAGLGTLDFGLFAGNIVSQITTGAGIRCVRGSNATGTGRPTIHCTSFEVADGNTAPAVDGSNCRGAYDAGLANHASDIDGYQSEYCEADPVNYSIKDCSLDAGSNCSFGLAGHDNRGAAANDATCASPCGLVFAIEEQSWGSIKAMYR